VFVGDDDQEIRTLGRLACHARKQQNDGNERCQPTQKEMMVHKLKRKNDSESSIAKSLGARSCEQMHGARDLRIFSLSSIR
jgi:hypothetical protein